MLTVVAKLKIKTVCQTGLRIDFHLRNKFYEGDKKKKKEKK